MKHSLGSSRRAAIAALPRLVLKRAFSEKTFVSLRLIGLTIAVAVSAGVFIYLDALGQSALSQSLSGHLQQDLNVAVRARNDSVSHEAHRALLTAVNDTRSKELSQGARVSDCGGKVGDARVRPRSGALEDNAKLLGPRRWHRRRGDLARRCVAFIRQLYSSA